MLNGHTRNLAVVTGASSGIGLELARCCAQRNFDLLLVADELEVCDGVEALQAFDVNVEPLVADLATQEGIHAVLEAVAGRRVEMLLANAGRGLGRAFLDQSFSDVMQVINTNITGTLMLIHDIGNRMRKQGGGKIMVTGSIAGVAPGAFQAVYQGTTAMLDSFTFALREELLGSGVSVTCLMPGATDTEFFARAGLMDTKEAVSVKQSARAVAIAGFEAMMKGEAGVVPGFVNKINATLAHILPATILAHQSRKLNEPGTAQ